MTLDDRQDTEVHPEPENSGVDPRQEAAREPTVLPAIQAKPEGITGFELSEAVGAIGEVRGQAGMLFLQVYAVRLERENGQLRLERNEALAQSNKYRDLYAEENKRSAVLQERLRAIRKGASLHQIMIAAGGLVVGVIGPDLLRTPTPAAGFFAAIGLALMFFGWFSGSREGGD